MTALRRLAVLSVVLGVGHIVFGAIVRITGSGMGCGDHWPKCQGYWFPPLDRTDLIIEITHRWFAATLSLAIVILLIVALLRRRTPGVGGAGAEKAREQQGQTVRDMPALRPPRGASWHSCTLRSRGTGTRTEAGMAWGSRTWAAGVTYM